MQPPTKQEPPEQSGVPLAIVQGRLQPPQWLRLRSVLVSQPVVYWPSQSRQGAVQEATPQLPLLQSGAPFCTVQVRVQLPQVRTLVPKFDSQPSVLEALQSAKGRLQPAIAQLPPAQPGGPCW